MATGYAGIGVPGLVKINALQSSNLDTLIPQVVLDDPVNGSVALHLGGEGAAPGIAVRIAGAGTSATAVLDANATDLCHNVALTTGSAAWGTGVQCTVTYAVPMTKNNYPVFSAANDLTAQLWNTLQPSINAVGLTGYTVNFHVADSSTSHALAFNVLVAGH